MLCMIREVVAGLGMGKDGEVSAIEREELSHVAERIAGHGQLHASPRVRADGAKVEVPDRDRKARLHRRGELPRALDLGRVVIDVRMEIADRRLGHGTAYS